jgi:hypothetical protein
MIGLTIAMLMVAQEAPIDVPARCRAVAVRLERTGRLAPARVQARYAGAPAPVQQAMFARHIREVRAAQALVKTIRVRYPGSNLGDPEVDRLSWDEAFAEGESCRDGTR